MPAARVVGPMLAATAVRLDMCFSLPGLGNLVKRPSFLPPDPLDKLIRKGVSKVSGATESVNKKVSKATGLPPPPAVNIQKLDK